MNLVTLMGRLTKDVDLRFTQGAQPMAVARFNLAVDRRAKQDGTKEADFISCIAFGKTGENIQKFFNKGSKIAVVGRIQTGSYTKQDGTNVYTTDVVVEGFDFCEKASNTANQPAYGAQPTSYAPQNAPQYAPQAPQNQQAYAQPMPAQQVPQYRQNYGTIPPQNPATEYPPEQAQQAVEAINQGFMQIPDGVDEGGLPWNRNGGD